mmetsp:Transcript_28249/g.69850  ORF Transcript_28249/g.69850 Transcript_28249/m.69850 type:complete len:533 (+) Transcript_28249:114-1712(+)
MLSRLDRLNALALCELINNPLVPLEEKRKDLCGDLLRTPSAAPQRPIQRRAVHVVSCQEDVRLDLQLLIAIRGGLLVGLAVVDAVRLEQLPLFNGLPEPALELLLDLGRGLLVRLRRHPDQRHRRERLALGGVGRGHRVGEAHVVDSACALSVVHAVAVEIENRLLDRGLAVQGKVQAHCLLGLPLLADARLRRRQQPPCHVPLGRQHHGAGLDRLPTRKRHRRPILRHSLDRRVQLDGALGQQPSHVIRHSLNASLGEAVLAECEHAENEVELARGGPELVVEENAAEERPEEAVHHLLGEARPEKHVVAQPLLDRDVGAVPERVQLPDQRLQPQHPHQHLVHDRSDRVRGQQRQHGVERHAERVGDPVEAAVPADEGAGVEGLELELLVIEQALGLGVRGEEDLEPTVEEEPVDVVGPHAPPHPVGRLHDGHGDALLSELDGARHACHARSHHHHLLLRTPRLLLGAAGAEHPACGAPRGAQSLPPAQQLATVTPEFRGTAASPPGGGQPRPQGGRRPKGRDPPGREGRA